MIKKRGRLAVVSNGRVVGIVTTSDLIKSIPDTSDTFLGVESFMTRELEKADEKTTVAAIAKIMGQKRVGSVIVTKGGKPFGIFTERDLLTNFLAKGKSLDIQVGKAASTPLITAPLWISVHEAASIMSNKHIRRLPLTVDEAQSDLVGIITARDLVEVYAKY
jgi:CBS domain-containing protein